MGAFSDIDLISRVLASDDRHAFSELVKRYQSAVRAMMRKLTRGDHFLSDELAQETFIRAYRNLKSFRGEAKFSTWLYRIGYNVFLSESRKSKNQNEDDLVNHIRSSEGVDEHQIILKIEIEKALSMLDKNEKAALIFSYWKEMSHSEIAEVMNCPLGTVKTLIARGKQRLRQELESFKEE